MAKDVTMEPWIFDATGQAEGLGAGGAFEHPIYVRQIKVDTGNGGDVLINTTSGGRRLLKLDNTPADDTLWVDVNATWRRFYIETLPTNATLEVYTGPAIGGR